MMVYPITDERHIRNIKKMLGDNPRNLLLFVMGINTGLRMGDLLKLKCGDVKGLSVGDKVDVREGKTGKHNYFIINKEIHRVLGIYFDTYPNRNEDDWLFPSRKGGNHLSVEGTNHLVKVWCKDVGIKENMGCHSLRKTFGYFQHKRFGVDLPVLMKRFSHSNQGITLRYIGLTDKQVNEVLMNDI
ncbi:MAG: tyrosine-type recombinase/integrase [Desulfobulbaceae bacterium]|nr:tyrosine-type recombinase/integrase [Desulfobulbaceae bacterium]